MAHGVGLTPRGAAAAPAIAHANFQFVSSPLLCEWVATSGFLPRLTLSCTSTNESVAALGTRLQVEFGTDERRASSLLTEAPLRVSVPPIVWVEPAWNVSVSAAVTAFAR